MLVVLQFRGRPLNSGSHGNGHEALLRTCLHRPLGPIVGQVNTGFDASRQSHSGSTIPQICMPGVRQRNAV